jgi:hypothetical protein
VGHPEKYSASGNIFWTFKTAWNVFGREFQVVRFAAGRAEVGDMAFELFVWAGWEALFICYA